MTDNLLIDKALKIAKKFNILDFKGSQGWLQKFKNRNKIKIINVLSEGSSALKVDPEVKENFLKILKEKIQEYGAENVYNGDKTGLF